MNSWQRNRESNQGQLGYEVEILTTSPLYNLEGTAIERYVLTKISVAADGEHSTSYELEWLSAMRVPTQTTPLHFTILCRKNLKSNPGPQTAEVESIAVKLTS
jgi:hypothetical protein